MLSIGVVKSSKNVHKYFTDEDNYYLMDKEEIKKSSEWMGKAAESLGISGQVVKEQDFLNFLNGKISNDVQIGLMKDGSIKHRPATDLTFSAPKSVSVMALVAGDKRLIKAHHKAVSVALKKAESLYAEARVTKNGETRYEKTDNLLIGAFQHTTSRELDPQLHTHGVVINATQKADGNWRALSSRAKADTTNIDHGFRENIYANQHYLGLMYISELALEIKNLNYNIEVKDKYGNFEIKELNSDYLDTMSKRKFQIKSLLKEKGFSGAKAAQNATLDSRQKKKRRILKNC